MFSSAWSSFRAHLAESSRPTLSPLTGDESIRLMQLAPTDNKHGFRVVLRQFRLADAPRFHVLSYARGRNLDPGAVADWAETGCEHFPVGEEARGVPGEKVGLEKAETSEKSKKSIEPVQPVQPIGESSWLNSLTGSLTAALPNIALRNGTLVTWTLDKVDVKVSPTVVSFLKLAYHQNRYRTASITPSNPASSKLDSKAPQQQQQQEETYLWIDSFCINAHDPIERARQVAQLAAVYRAASKTVAWLGPDEPPPGVDQLIREFLPDYLEADDAVYDLMWRLPSPESASSETSSPTDPAFPLWDQHALHFIAFLARHELLCRHGWMQEILLARHVELVCGHLSWDWGVLQRFVASSGKAARRFCAKLRSQTGTLKNICARYPRVVDEMETYRFVREYWVDGTAEQRSAAVTKWFGPARTSQEEFLCLMLKMARIMRGRGFMDKRDAIYGWLALGRLALPQGKTYASPSYVLSTRHIYVQFTKSLLKGMPVLHVLNDVGMTTWPGRRAGLGLPSWVPDYSRPSLPMPLHARRRDNHDVDFDATLTWTRGNNSEGGLEFVGDCLVVSGLKLDVIHKRSPGFPANILDSKETPVEWLLEKCAEMDEIYGPTGQAGQEALSFTLALDCLVLDNGQLTYTETFRGVWGFLIRRRMEGLDENDTEKLLSTMCRIASSAAGESWVPASREEVEKPEDWTAGFAAHVKVVVQVLKRMSRMMAGRAAFASRKGHWGVGSREVQIGDEIWLIDGGRTPFVLRPGTSPTNDYRLVGEAYVHGFMNGEGWIPEKRTAAVQRVRIA